MRRNKNKYGYNFPFQVLPFNQPKNIPIGSTLIEYGSMKLKIERVFIFVTPPLCQKKNLRFDPTLSSNNSGLKNDSIKNQHIFGNGRTSALSYPDFSTSVTSKKKSIINKYTLWKVLQSIFMLVYHDNSFNIASRVEWRKTKLSPYSNVSRVISFWKIKISAHIDLPL